MSEVSRADVDAAVSKLLGLLNEVLRERDEAIEQANEASSQASKCGDALIKRSGDYIALLRERDEAREVAFEFWLDLPYMGDYLFEKHHGTDLEEYPWLAKIVKERTPEKPDEL